MNYYATVIGTGFGANVVANNLAARFPNTTGKPQILMLERGVWWFSPERPLPPPFAANFDAKYPPGDQAAPPRPYSSGVRLFGLGLGNAA